MAVKLTKNELKKQKDDLKRFERYLPTLQLKKQQLQTVITQTYAELARLEASLEDAKNGLDDWVAVFAENRALTKKIDGLVQPLCVVCGEESIAGVVVPRFEKLSFADIDYDVRDYPLWVDAAVRKLRELAGLDAEVKTLRTRAELLGKEFRTTSQRVNLFEKVKIPEAQDNIRVIDIYLGDQQTSAVVRGKIAKKKLGGVPS